MGFWRHVRQPWITAGTLDIIDKRQEASLAKDLELYRYLNAERNTSLLRDRQAWVDGIADSAELAIQQGRPQEAFKSIKRLKAKGSNISANLRAQDGQLLKEKPAKLNQIGGILQFPAYQRSRSCFRRARDCGRCCPS